MLFRMAPSPTPYGLPFLKIGGLQLSYHLLSQEQVKLQISNLADTFIWLIGKKPTKNLGENGAWAYPERAHFLGWGVPPTISGTRAKLRTLNLAGTFTGTIRIKAY